MWYAPIGSLEYTKNLHNDILIKKYILSEQRLKQLNNASLYLKIQELSSLKVLTVAQSESEGLPQTKKTNNKNLKSARLNRIKGCAVDILVKRSFKRTSLNVITYDSLST